jgi:sigma-E factor negative regulatory protein RseA
MDDRLRETLSAMLDDEADELAVRRVLAQGDSEQVQAQWLRWQRLREQMRGHDERWSGIDIRAGIWDRLEVAPERSPQPAEAKAVSNGTSAMRGPGTAALVAMFVVALVLGFGAGQQWSVDEAEAVFAGTTDSGTQQAVAANVPSVPLQDLDEEQWEQLSDYLLRHAQHNSVAAGHGAVGFARVASVSPGTP